MTPREDGLWGSRELREGRNEEAARSCGTSYGYREALSGSPSEWPLAELIPGNWPGLLIHC